MFKSVSTPRLRRRNLDVETRAFVTKLILMKIIVKSNRRDFQENGKEHTVHATKLFYLAVLSTHNYYNYQVLVTQNS